MGTCYPNQINVDTQEQPLNMSSQVPRWFQLLHYFHTRADGRRYYGMTFPFMIGALRNPAGGHAALDAKKEMQLLLTAMLNETPPGFVLRIARCDHLQQSVVSPHTNFYEIAGQALFSDVLSRDVLFLDDQQLRDSPSINVVAERLWRVSRNPIIRRKFSFWAGDFHQFTEEELVNIRLSANHTIGMDDE